MLLSMGASTAFWHGADLGSGGWTWGPAAGPGGWHSGWLTPGSSPRNLLDLDTFSKSDPGGWQSRAREHGMVQTRHSTAAWLCSSLRSGGPLCAGLGEQRVERGERGPLSWLIPGRVKRAHMATRVHANDPSPSTLMIRPRQQR